MKELLIGIGENIDCDSSQEFEHTEWCKNWDEVNSMIQHIRLAATEGFGSEKQDLPEVRALKAMDAVDKYYDAKREKDTKFQVTCETAIFARLRGKETKDQRDLLGTLQWSPTGEKVLDILDLLDNHPDKIEFLEEVLKNYPLVVDLVQLNKKVY